MKLRKICKLYIKTLKLLKVKVLMNDRKVCIEGDLPTDTYKVFLFWPIVCTVRNYKHVKASNSLVFTMNMFYNNLQA